VGMRVFKGGIPVSGKLRFKSTKWAVALDRFALRDAPWELAALSRAFSGTTPE